MYDESVCKNERTKGEERRETGGNNKYKKKPRQVQGKKNRYSRKTDWG